MTIEANGAKRIYLFAWALSKLRLCSTALSASYAGEDGDKIMWKIIVSGEE